MNERDALEKVLVPAFDAARIKSLSSYGSLEFAQFQLFCTLMQSKTDVASAVFYNIGNSHSRY